MSFKYTNVPYDRFDPSSAGTRPAKQLIAENTARGGCGTGPSRAEWDYEYER